MSCGRQGYWWEKLLHRVPGLTLWCPGGNRHFRWQKVCFCENHCNGWGVMFYCGGNTWVNLTGSNDGITRLGMRYQPYRKR